MRRTQADICYIIYFAVIYVGYKFNIKRNEKKQLIFCRINMG